MVFFIYVAMKIAVFSWLQNIHLIYLVSAAVTYKDYHSQSDR